MNLTGTIPIETPRLLLRRFRQSDAEMMYLNWASDDDVTKFLLWPTHSNIEVSRNIISMWEEQYGMPDTFQWAMELKNENQVIGSVTLFNVNREEKSAEIGYCIGKLYWNKGLMSEACRYVFDFGFNTVGFQTVYGRHEIDNPASGKVMTKNNMKYIGDKEEFKKKDNCTRVMKCYRIQKEEFL